MGIVNKLLGMPSKADQERAAYLEQEAAKPVRQPDPVRQSDSVVLATPDTPSDVDKTGTDISVARARKQSRRGVPGLGL